ncbi:long-chain fatty acid--CoA ligase [Diaphorobacter sp. HDW4B]|uniref:long-chain fatty acid--CoA ligase n=1 Tax=Diaphorobacter sp. HDW4B TaxID=2714925 RepID=UPI00140CFEEB|nr:long-chain fatty acid--CoA ligase [Diaphorobacter sp. HDW4B]QIL72574.1 long-chain fatty acid--CoA ligase [Diaphorobacter sp. HDW4B]
MSLHASHAMDIPFLLSNLLQGAARHHKHGEIVSVIHGQTVRHTYADCELRARKLAQGLKAMGIQHGDRVATLAWNDHRHYEMYFGIPGIGAICHTVNPRLFVEQIVYIINNAQDVALFYSADFQELVDKVRPHCPSVRHWLCLDSADGTAPSDYEALLAQHAGDMVWPEFDERSDAFLCYTSGTTGQPKGVLYTHRSTVIHAYAVSLPDAQNVSAMSVLMPVVPMFHANAWESPFATTLTGAKLVLPGSKLDGASLHRLIDQEGVTMSIGVPTIWFNVLSYMQQNNVRVPTLKRLLLGGSPTPLSMIEAYHALGIQVTQGWGMTETAAMTTTSQPLAQHRDVPLKEQHRTIYQSAGRAVPGADMRTVDDAGKEIPWGSKQPGELQVRAPWVIKRYFNAPADATTPDGWLPTGDVALIDEDGYMRLTDRSKDVIKSGGEWISSVDLENLATAIPGVYLAACIAGQHERWGERPILVIEPREAATLTEAEVLSALDGKIAKWWMPDAVIFIDKMPLTATGKLSKLELRNRFGTHLLGKS